MPDLSRFLGLPLDASAHGHQLDYMLGLVHWLMLVLFIGWGAFFIYSLIRFRASKHPKATYQGARGRFSTYQELGVVVAEAIFLIGFAFPIWASLKNDFPPEKDAVVVHVVAEQFAWNIHYPGPDGVFGRREVRLVDSENNPLGLDRKDANARDDIVLINELHLPMGKPAIVHLTSKDVIHSFSLPVMRVKQDAIPGLSIPVWFVPTRTGEFEIACAQLCGLGHYRMRGYLIVHTPEGFEKWLEAVREDQIAVE